MKVLFFTKYSRKGASSRLRSYQYITIYKSEGIECKVSELFNDFYLNNLYKNGKANIFIVIYAYIKRFIRMFYIRRYDIIVIEKELFPFLPSIAEKTLKLLNIPFIVDYDDAIFHNYDLSTNKFIKFFLANKIKYVMRYATTVIAGNNYIADYAKKSGANHVIIIPTVIDLNKYHVKNDFDNECIVIGWIGTPVTLKYLKSLYPVLNYICNNYSVKVHIIGGKSGIGLLNKEKLFEWNEDTEVDLIRSFDIGIMPLENSSWERGKCGYKLIQYMGCGVPVIGSPVGVNNDIINQGVNGFKALNLEQWKKYLIILIEDRNLRVKMSLEGRKIVNDGFSLQLMYNKWKKLLLTYNIKHCK